MKCYFTYINGKIYKFDSTKYWLWCREMGIFIVLGEVITHFGKKLYITGKTEDVSIFL